MDKNLFTTLFVLLFFISSSNNFAQRKAFYFSITAGDYKMNLDNFAEIYKSNHGFIFGFSVGGFANKYFGIEGSASYYQKSSTFPSDENNNEFNNATLKQFILTSGLAINPYPNNYVNLILVGGGTMAQIDDEHKNKDGGFIYETEGFGNFGYYLGANLSIGFGKIPFVLYSELRMTKILDSELKYNSQFEVIDLRGGIRFFLSR